MSCCALTVTASSARHLGRAFFIDIVKLDDDDFTLFGLPQRFAQDGAEIAQRWKALAAKVHPDRFAADGAASQRLAMQWSLRVNEAHQRLRDPLKRASYLCELRGAPIQANENTRMPAAFLMEQMEWRESLDEAKTPQPKKCTLPWYLAFDCESLYPPANTTSAWVRRWRSRSTSAVGAKRNFESSSMQS